MIRASSGRSSRSARTTGPKRSMAWREASRLVYVSPPPPAPSTEHPRAIGARCSTSIRRRRLTRRPRSSRERGGVWGTGRFPTSSEEGGPVGETWFPPRTRAGGDRWSRVALQRVRVIAARMLLRDVLVPKVAADGLGVPLPGVAVATAAAGVEVDARAFWHLKARDLGVASARPVRELHLHRVRPRLAASLEPPRGVPGALE